MFNFIKYLWRRLKLRALHLELATASRLELEYLAGLEEIQTVQYPRLESKIEELELQVLAYENFRGVAK